ncbi:MAG: hypothetical protein AAFU64_00115 [Bacteroidota bacterium]
MKNKFFENLKKIDPENFEYKVDREFEEETGIKGKRFQTIIRSGGKSANVDEVRKLLSFFTRKKGRKVEFDELFGMSGEDSDVSDIENDLDALDNPDDSDDIDIDISDDF